MSFEIERLITHLKIFHFNIRSGRMRRCEAATENYTMTAYTMTPNDPGKTIRVDIKRKEGTKCE